MIAVFARADHPEGYGFPDGRAHGYVVLFVRCDEQEQIAEVAQRLSREDFQGIGSKSSGYNEGQLREWYGGRFDLLAVVPEGYYVDMLAYGGRFVSKGDNRFVGLFSAEEILDATDHF